MHGGIGDGGVSFNLGLKTLSRIQAFSGNSRDQEVFCSFPLSPCLSLPPSPSPSLFSIHEEEGREDLVCPDWCSASILALEALRSPVLGPDPL